MISRDLLPSLYTFDITKGSIVSMTNEIFLSRESVSPKDLLLKSAPAKTGIVHIGLGNFHRAHLAVYTAIAMQEKGGDWGICTYSMRSEKTSNAMNAQDNLYSVLEIGPDTRRTYIPGVHTQALAGKKDLRAIIDLIAKPETKIVSLTVTEAGYFISQASQGLDLGNSDIRSDLTMGDPLTIYGILAQSLLRRSSANESAITILSCDNISQNGDNLKRLLNEFIGNLPDCAELLKFVEDNVTFPNSMVDRIVPGSEPQHIQIVKEQLGLVDAIPVPTEKFSMWALEDNFIGGRPAWDVAGAIFTDEVHNFEVMKLRLLNGSHSLLAYLGALRGRETIPACRFDELIELSLRKVIQNEYLPSVEMPQSVDSNNYIAQLFERWSNTALGDKTYRVGTDGSTKLPQRITVPALRLINAGLQPKMLALTVASWLTCVAPFGDFDPGAIATQMGDPKKGRIQSLSKESTSPLDFVEKFFKESEVFSPEISSNDFFTSLVKTYFDSIYMHGITHVLTRGV